MRLLMSTNKKLLLIILLLVYVIILKPIVNNLNGYKIEPLYAFFKNHQIEQFKEEFILNPGSLICRSYLNKSIFFISFVILAPEHFAKRMIIRSTWGNTNISHDFRIFFSIGLSKNNTVNKEIEDEYSNYQDILQINMTGDFIYYNKLINELF